MAFTSNIAAINAANRALKTVGFASDAATLKAARAKHFKIEKVEGEWHALIIAPLPDALTQAQAIAASPEQPEPTKEQIVAEARKSHLIGQPEPEQASPQAQAASAAAAAFFASQSALSNPVELADASPSAGNDPEIGADATSNPPSAEEFARMQAAADAQANAQQSASDLKNGKVWIHASTCESPVKRVWAIADAMIAAAQAHNLPRPSRKEIQDECVRQGVASGTARTQYQAWKKANDNDAANAANAAALSAALNGKKHS